jgi:hypothetical protein
MTLLKMLIFFILSLYQKKVIEDDKPDINRINYFNFFVMLLILSSVSLNVFFGYKLVAIYEVIKNKCSQILLQIS